MPSIFDGWITEEEYARQRGKSVRTCQRDRQLRQSPPYTVIGKQVYYRIDAVREWLRGRERGTSPAPRAPRRARA